ncbi:hypothetical protein DOY81_008216, partial [Sarcophaga bullata]
GTSLLQSRFNYNEIEQLRYALIMRHRIDMSRVKLDVLMPWICEQVCEVYDIEDFVYEELKKQQYACPRTFQIKLFNFLSVHKVLQFTSNLFEVLLASQQSGIGIPPFLMQQLKREEKKKRRRNDSCKSRYCSCSRCSKRDDKVVNDKNSNQSSSKREKSRSRDKQLGKNTGYASSDSCSPQSEQENRYSMKTSGSKSSQRKEDKSCMRSKSVEEQGASSTSKYALRKCDDTSDDSDESPQCAWCGRKSCSPQSSVSSNQSRSSRSRSATREDDGKEECRREKQITEVVEKCKHSDVKDGITISSQTSVTRSKTRSEKEITITPLSSLATKGSSNPEHKQSKFDNESGETVNSGKVVLEVASVNCTQSAMSNKCKHLKNDSSHVNEQSKCKKKRKKPKKSSSKRNSVDHCPRNSESGSSKNKNHKNNDSNIK